MPARQPFTALCQAAARQPTGGRADLHIHSTFSDGAYTPAEIVDLARRSGLAAVAITDHDTVDGIAPARDAALASSFEIVAGVEISAEHRGKELHLLGYFFRTVDGPLTGALERLRLHRINRFREMVERLRGCGVSLDEDAVRTQLEASVLGRRHLAMLIVKAHKAASIREAFMRYLGDRGRVAVPKVRVPVADAIALVRGAGGVAAWAHPAYDGIREALAELRGLGLQAVEVEYPTHRRSLVRELRDLASSMGLAITGGSDCHGPGHPHRAIGANGISGQELTALRELRTQ
jgi:predicted metal-dependent phosphoesterase TrpH